MARTFGNAASDRVASSYATYNGAFSFACWARRTGDGGNGFGRLYNASTSRFYWSGTPDNVLRINWDWSTQTGQWDFGNATDFPLNTWTFLGFKYSDSASSNKPDGFINTTKYNPSLLTGAVGTPPSTFANLVLGNRHLADRNWAGDLAWATAWNVQLDDQEFFAMARGMPPWRIRPDSIVWCLPLWGVHSPEIDLKHLNGTGTVTGTSRATSDPPLLPPWTPPSAIIGAGGSTYNDSITEAIAGADALAALATLSPALTEAIAALDGAGVAGVVAPSLTETAMLVDTATGGSIFADALSEGITAAELVAAVSLFNPALIEAIAASDSLAVAATLRPALVEALGVTDAPFAPGGSTEALIESLSLADLYTAALLWQAQAPGPGAWSAQSLAADPWTTQAPASGTWTRK